MKLAWKWFLVPMWLITAIFISMHSWQRLDHSDAFIVTVVFVCAVLDAIRNALEIQIDRMRERA